MCDFNGGGIFNEATALVASSTVNRNGVRRTNGQGGGIFNYGGAVEVTNSTITDNARADFFKHDGTGITTNSTIVPNGVANNVGDLIIRNSIIPFTPCSSDIGSVVYEGVNIASGGCACIDPFPECLAVDPKLDLEGLKDNGGPTKTIAISATSPARDAADPAICSEASPTGPGSLDQRRFARGATCDIGAFEFGAGPSCAGLEATLVGTLGDDVLVGTEGPDVIVGLGGDDEIDGLGGNDVICGGAGGDLLLGDTGADVLKGGRGDDVLAGNDGNDVLNGGRGSDRLLGGHDADVLRDVRGPNDLDGGPGTDECEAAIGDIEHDCET